MGKLIKETDPLIKKEMQEFAKAYLFSGKAQKKIAREAGVGISAVWKFQCGYRVGRRNRYCINLWVAQHSVCDS